MKKLDEVWHAMEAAPTAFNPTGHRRTADPQALHTVTAGDRSASIALPDNWHLTGVSGGQSLSAEGPDPASRFNLGIMYPADP